MENVVYITGAGFSAPLGLPLMSNFMEKARDLYNRNQQKYKHFEEVFKTIRDMAYCQTYYHTDLTNIEEILSILDMQNKLSYDKSPTFFIDFIIDVINGLTPLIPEIDMQKASKYYKEWFTQLFGPNELLLYYGEFVLCLFKLNLIRRKTIDYEEEIFVNEIEYLEKDKQYSIITLNYDRILENTCTYINNCYKNSPNINLNSQFVQDNNNFPNLVKLHGCVEKKTIIPPTWNKGLGNEDILQSWKFAHKLLSEANYIRIIGYSLPTTDSYIKYLLKSALIDIDIPHLKQIDIICKSNNDNLKTHYNNFINWKNIRFVNKDFTFFLKALYESLKITDKNDNKHFASFTGIEEVHEQFMDENKL